MSRPPAQVGATERLSRLLAMVPWLLQRQGVPLVDAAHQFGITEDQLVKDLELLFVCGTPGHLPDDLIEAEWESGKVYVGNAEEISRPLRLAVDEAVALLVGLRTLAEVPGLHGREAVDSAAAKLSAAAGEAAAAAGAVAVEMEAGEAEGVLTAVREALRRRRRLQLRYLVPARDETTERDVDPMRVLAVDGRWYLEGWCHRVDGVRMFRLDRVVTADLLDEDGTPPPEAVSRDVGEGLFQPGPDDAVVVLHLQPQARWVVDQYPPETVEELPDGALRVRVRAADPAWVPRLVLRAGGGVRVLSPASLAARAAAEAEAALERYATPSGTSSA